MPSSRTFHVRTIGVLVFFAISLNATTFHLQDTFTDGFRNNQSLPSSAAWYAANNGLGLNVVSNQLVLTTLLGNVGTISYFTPTLVDLQIGESLYLDFNFTLGGLLLPADRALGFYFFNSGGNRISADDTTGFNSSVFNGYTGYGITYDPQSSNPTRYRTVERNVTNNNLFATAANVALGTSIASSVLNAGQTYTGRLTLTRGDVSSVTISGNINGNVISNTDTVSVYTQFDTIAFMAVSPFVPTLTLDNIEVGTDVPEPSSLLLLGGGLLALWARRRQKRHVN